MKLKMFSDWAKMTVHFRKDWELDYMIDFDNVDWTRDPNEDTYDFFEALESECGEQIAYVKLTRLDETWIVENNNE